MLDLVGIGWETQPEPGSPPHPSARLLLGRGDGTFAMPRELSRAIFAATGDFNGDGRPDLVLGNPDTLSLTILIANGDGSFRTISTMAGGGLQPVVADFNLDGKADFGVASSNAIMIFLGQGDGGFQAALLTSADRSGPLAGGRFQRRRRSGPGNPNWHPSRQRRRQFPISNSVFRIDRWRDSFRLFSVRRGGFQS